MNCADQLTPGDREPGFYSPEEISDEIKTLHSNVLLGDRNLCDTGFPSLDKHLRIRKGEFFVVTGMPGQGKSDFVDQLMMNMSQRHGWRIAYASMENLPIERHVAKLIEKYVGEPFFSRRDQMNEKSVDLGIWYAQNHFHFFHPGDSTVTPDGIMRHADDLRKRWGGLDALIVDPWNELEHTRTGRYSGMSDTDYLSLCLSQFRRFARNINIALFVVAHPTKMQRRDDDSYPIPRAYDIAGGAHWYNKADVCMCVSRDITQKGDINQVDVHIQKVRFKEVGFIGVVEFDYDKRTSRFSEIKKEDEDGSYVKA